LMGDFNALTPGEPFDASRLLARVMELDDERQRTNSAMHGHPHLTYVVPPLLRPLIPLLRHIPSTPWLARLFGLAANLYLPRWAVPQLVKAGYRDCLRATYAARDVPPTCPLPKPAGRIDYLWADPTLAERVQGCEVVTDEPGCPVNVASDHRPVLARFARVASQDRMPEPMVDAHEMVTSR